MIQAIFITQPASGEHREKIIDVPFREHVIRPWSWVLFCKDDYTEWVACLHGGENAYRHVDVVGTLAFVIADGQGYFIDGQTEELIYYTAESTIRSVVADDQNGLFAYTSDEGDLLVIDQSFVPRPVSLPFQFYTIKLEKIAGKFLVVTYEDRTTNEFKTAWVDMTEAGATR
ncbi:hypothetical protein CLV58_105166 [Spirosoma oryzae]|uniref:Uncharacterized protein n=1 Tax=Spirosoma oryzae TaxID=1469603 RepID=A0A2T0T8K1_9BACT|nr:hypothetical protein [Spirosoma oryzae]PRY41964.1 hypothetical protein CLV58_105166 [Spirosoma oryzae]